MTVAKSLRDVVQGIGECYLGHLAFEIAREEL